MCAPGMNDQRRSRVKTARKTPRLWVTLWPPDRNRLSLWSSEFGSFTSRHVPRGRDLIERALQVQTHALLRCFCMARPLWKHSLLQLGIRPSRSARSAAFM
jgi:hypothetical protein